MTDNELKQACYGDDVPIAAFATAPGSGALTLIRCSGKNSILLFSPVFSNVKIIDAAGNTVIHGSIIKKGGKKEAVDEVLVSVFRAPKSYTGEDSLDICCHGGFIAGNAVMDVLRETGFRAALPGEFTFRAFMNGKLDLTRSESVMELVNAKTETGRRHAVSRLSGSLEKEINYIKNLLVQTLASSEIYLDYSEDEVSADDKDEIEGILPNRSIALDALSRLKKLSASWQMERIYQEGITLVIAGPPNAGKSSLFNLLLKEERSIVTEIPGTTRDWIEAWVSIKGIPMRIIDTAGLRETSDTVEKIGVDRSFSLLKEADIVLYLIDGECGISNDDIKYISDMHFDAGNGEKNHTSYIFVWNKSDITLPQSPFPAENISLICVSVKNNTGLNELYTAVTAVVYKKAGSNLQLEDSAALGTARQKKLIDAAYSSLDEALAMSEQKIPLDLIAPLLREAVNSLGEITGEVSAADILEEMFSKFCVGK